MADTRTHCQSCLMPFTKDPRQKTREHPDYCSYCYSNGRLHAADAKSLKDFQRTCFKVMRQEGMPWPLAKLYTHMIKFAPYWKARSQKSG